MISGISQLLGQDKIVSFFSRSLKEGRVPHALIFSGPKGSGKLEIVRNYAMEVLGTENPENPNIRVIDLYKPEIKYVDEIRRNIVDNILYAPYGADNKFYIIAGAEKMPAQAQNAILKSLEEPPEYASIIMLTDDPGKLLPTIRSRSVRLYMKAVEKPVIEEYLKSIGCDEKEAAVCSAFAQGNMSRAIELSQDRQYLDHAEEVIRVISQIATRQKPPAYYYELIKEYSESLEDFLELLEILIRDVLVYKVSGPSNIDLPWPGEIKKMAERCSFEHLGGIRRQLSQTRLARLSNVSKDVLMELLLIEIGGSIENTSRSAF